MGDAGFEILKDIPGFQAILKTLVKSQMQHLVCMKFCRAGLPQSEKTSGLIRTNNVISQCFVTISNVKI